MHGIVVEHGGAVRATSEPGTGTVFQIYLPAVESAVPEHGSAPNRPRLRAAGRVLFVDDENFIVEMVELPLSQGGFSVATAASGEAALALFREGPERFDVMVTAMAMPGMSGLQLAREVHKIRPNLPVLLCTGFSEMVDEATLGAAGISRLLMKPVSLEELAETVVLRIPERREQPLA